MKMTKEQIAAHYFGQKKLQAVPYDHDELVCTYLTKTLTKAVFMTEILDRETFRRLCIIKNEMRADKMIVHCEYAYYLSEDAEVRINRAD